MPVKVQNENLKDVKKIDKKVKAEERKNKIKKAFTFTSGLEKYKRNFLQNFAILLSAGMDVLTALESTQEEIASRRMKKFLNQVIEKVKNGGSLWKSLYEIDIFSPRIISLIRIGEESGRLVENVTTVVEQLEKEWLFKSKIRTAMLYPAIVLPLTFFVGIGAGWFTLPKLASLFSQLDAELPYLTRLLIKVGDFLGEYGNVFVPTVLFSFTIVLYFLFSFPRTKALGQILISKLPIFRRLIMEVELARIGYILSSLFKSGIPIINALESLHDSTTFYSYKKFYKYLASSVEVGQSFKESFKGYKRLNKLIPLSIQHMIISGEDSGKLGETLGKIGKAYETKIETSIKDISTIMEPVLLIFIGIVVASIAIAILMPIYSLTNII